MCGDDDLVTDPSGGEPARIMPTLDHPVAMAFGGSTNVILHLLDANLGPSAADEAIVAAASGSAYLPA